jgi:predicted transporter
MGRFVGDIDWSRFLLGYVAILAAILAAAFALHQWLGIQGERSIYRLVGLLFVIAAIGRPPYLYRVVRNTGWFSGIESDRMMRTVLLILAALLFGLAFVRR